MCELSEASGHCMIDSNAKYVRLQATITGGVQQRLMICCGIATSPSSASEVVFEAMDNSYRAKSGMYHHMPVLYSLSQ